MAAKLILIRGVVGSGKTTLAQQMVKEGKADTYVEADMFFVCPITGEYKFDGSQISQAHDWCRFQAMQDLAIGKTVIVSNTFTRKWEMEPYVLFAEENNIPVEVIVCRGDYGNVHGVPPEAVERMRSRWEE